MSESFGKLESVHVLAPVYAQRAAILAVVSFLFFVAMLIAFSLWENIGYFLLATAFLIVELLTLGSLYVQRRAQLKVYQNGFTYKKYVCRWHELADVKIKSGGKFRCEIVKKDGAKFTLGETLHDIELAAKRIHARFTAEKNAPETVMK